jgi:hypothetical protein
MANKKWIQKANKKMKEKGTVGSFTKYCGGRVTQSCIDRAIKSDDPTLRRRAQFAANMRGIGTKKGRAGIRREREEMFLGGALKALGAVGKKVAGKAASGGVGKFGEFLQGDKFGAIAGAAEGVGGGVGSAVSGIASGAKLGAALGTVVPGIGNIVGAAIGGIAGGLKSIFKGRKAKKEAEKAKADAEAKEKKMKHDMLKAQYQAQYDATIQNMPQENYENVNQGVAYKKGGRKNKGLEAQSDVNYQTYSGTTGKSMSRETAKKMWDSKASADEKKLGFKLTQDADGNYIVRTKTEVKAQYGMRTEAVEGKRRLPGGLELKLKNGAKKFVGNKHDEAGNGSDSGIILEHSTKTKKGLEVEDGELEVKDDKGSYIVSNYLKNPETGNTLAKDLENELKGLDKNKDAKKIKQINDKYIDLNEKLKDKKKEPDKVKAVHGARRAYMENGGRVLKSYEEFVAAYPKFDNHQDAYITYINDMVQGDDLAAKAAKASLDEVNSINDQQGHQNVHVGMIGETDETGTVSGVNMIPDAEVADPVLPLTQRQVAQVVQPEPEKSLQEPGANVGEGVETPNRVADKLEELNQMDGPSDVPMEDAVEEETEGKGVLEKVGDFLGKIPRGYGQGTMLQALGAAAYLKNRDDPMAPILAPSYISRIPPAEYKSFAPERAAATAAYNAQANAIDTSIAGPAAIAARQAAMASQAANMSKIATQDVRERARINQLNANNELRIALANQKAYNDTTRANASAKYAADLEKFENKYAALNKIGDTTAQALKDRRQAQSERLFAAATQIGGSFDRAEERYGFNKLFPFLAQDKSVQGGISAEEAQALALLNGQTVSDEEAAAAAVDQTVQEDPDLQDQVDEATDDMEQEKRGGRRKRKKRYIKRKGTVRRRRKIKKK